MATTTRRIILAVVTAIALVALGAGVGVVVGDALGIRTEPAAQMEPAPPVVPDGHRPLFRAACTPPIDAPPTVRVDVALEELEDATADASRGDAGESSLTVVAGTGDPADDTYRLVGPPGRAAHRSRQRDGGGARHLRPRSADPHRTPGR